MPGQGVFRRTAVVVGAGLGVAVLAWPTGMAAALTAPVTPVQSPASSATSAPSPTAQPAPVSAPAPASSVPAALLPLADSLAATLGVVSPSAPTAPGTASPRTADTGGTLTVQPDSNLTNGQTVTVTGSGMKPSSYGSVLECNLTDNEPTVQVEGNAVPVGCTDPLKTIQSTDSSGGFTKQFTVHTGTIGPPAQGTDSAGQPASSDAAKYPCPPTPAQQASGSTCDIVFGDTGGDQNTTPITFAGQSSGSSSGGGPSASSTGGGSSSTGGGSSGGSTASSGSGSGASTAAGGSGGTLAFTGLGHGLLVLTKLGLLSVLSGLILVGALLLRMLPGLERRRTANDALADQQ